MKLIELESRACPSFLGSRDGIVFMPDDSVLPVPFPDFPAAHATAGDENVIAVGAAEGGGPRVRVFEHNVSIGDAFAYESTFRDGVKVAYEDGIVVTGTNPGGGPVVAVFDKNMNQLARFFAYDPAFRGGVSVAIKDDVIYTVPGPGGGPVLKAFSLDGVEISARFGASPDARDGWDLIIGDATGDKLDDITLATQTGRISIVDGDSGFYAGFNLPAGYTLAGYEGTSLTVGNAKDYLRARALWTSFPTMIVFDEIDGAAGNQNPPPTTGTRPGVYRPTTKISNPPPSLEDMETFATVYTSASVGTANVGTGSSYPYLTDSAGSKYIVTASHLGRRSPFFDLLQVGELTAPGRLDGSPVTVGTPHSMSAITPGVPYDVDAVAFAPVPGTVLSHDVAFNGETVEIHGVAGPVQFGDLLIAVGRGKFLGSGTVYGYQANPVPIKWPSGDVVEVEHQITGVGGAVRLAEPGFSGGLVFHAAFVDDEEIRREIVGMTVAGNQQAVFITPHNLIEAALDMTWR